MAQREQAPQLTALPLPESVPRRIRALRRYREWSQDRLADEASTFGRQIKRPRIVDIEKGGMPTFVELVQVARAMGVSIGDLGATTADYPEVRTFRGEDVLEVLATPS